MSDGDRRRRVAGPGEAVGRAPFAAGLALLSILGFAGCAAEDDDASGVATLEEEVGAPAEAAEGLDGLDERELEEAQLEFASCMRDQGIDYPDPGGEGEVDLDRFEDPDFREALQECEPVLTDAVGDVELMPQEQQRIREQTLAFAECMREEGVENYPDPRFDGAGSPSVGRDDFEDVDMEAPEVRAAVEACEEELQPSGAQGGP